MIGLCFIPIPDITNHAASTPPPPQPVAKWPKQTQIRALAVLLLCSKASNKQASLFCYPLCVHLPQHPHTMGAEQSTPAAEQAAAANETDAASSVPRPSALVVCGPSGRLAVHTWSVSFSCCWTCQTEADGTGLTLSTRMNLRGGRSSVLSAAFLSLSATTHTTKQVWARAR